MQKAATNLLYDTIQKREFALRIAQRASNVLGTICGHHVAQILSMIRRAARATRSWVGSWHPSIAM